MIESGKLDTPIEIHEATVTTSATGAPVATWARVTGSPQWAQYMPLKGQERLMAGQLQDAVEFKLRIRRDENVSSANRVYVNDVACEILGTPEDYRRAGDMLLHCRRLK